jgi:predicted esterase
LYLPSNYTPDRRWPVIYAFDPFARGKVPVELYKDAAEKFGYIVVGSNNARNGPGTEEMAAAEADWADTHRRLMIDKDRVYTTGLSGGARFATSFALYCYTCSIAGVIAHGATYPVKEGIPANDHFLYYVAIGDQDFNYPEVAALREKKEANRAEFKVKFTPGHTSGRHLTL